MVGADVRERRLEAWIGQGGSDVALGLLLGRVLRLDPLAGPMPAPAELEDEQEEGSGSDPDAREQVHGGQPTPFA